MDVEPHEPAAEVDERTEDEDDGDADDVPTITTRPSPDPHPVSVSSAMRTVAVPKERMAPSFQLNWPMARHHTG